MEELAAELALYIQKLQAVCHGATGFKKDFLVQANAHLAKALECLSEAADIEAVAESLIQDCDEQYNSESSHA